MDIELIKVILQFLGVIGVGGIMAGVVSRKLTKSEQKKAEKEQEILDKETSREAVIASLCEATKVLLRSELYRVCDKVEQKEEFTPQEFEQLEETFRAYKSLNGNHLAEQRYKTVMESYKVNYGN